MAEWSGVNALLNDCSLCLFCTVDTRGVAPMAEWSGVNALLNDCSLCLSCTVDTRGVAPWLSDLV